MDAGPDLHTSRLLLRTWRHDDEPLMEKINRDPEVIRYLNRPVDDAAVARFHAGCIDHWQEHGFGFFAVESREEATLGGAG